MKAALAAAGARQGAESANGSNGSAVAKPAEAVSA
jgi:hypothetical protein